MAIVKMKKIRAIILDSARDDLFMGLQRIGCLEISEIPEESASPDWAGFLNPDKTRQEQVSGRLEKVRAALSALDRYAPEKNGLFARRPEIKQSDLFLESVMDSALLMSDEILEHAAAVNDRLTHMAKLNTDRTSLEPWINLDVPLDMASTPDLFIAFGVLPASVSLEQTRKALTQSADASEFCLSSSDNQQHYTLLLCHQSQRQDALEALKTYGFSYANLKNFSGTAAHNISEIDKQLTQLEAEKQTGIQSIRAHQSDRLNLRICVDRLTADLAREQALQKLAATEKTLFLDGWFPAPAQSNLESLLGRFDCAYELANPEPDDNVPVLLKNNKLTEPLSMVTEMYSLPAYDGIDPNPLIMLFFTLFFGIMYADIGYGIILIFGSLFISKKAKPRGTASQMMRLATLCGITTLICGFFFGSFFGDAVPQLTETFGGEKIDWFKNLSFIINPMEYPMEILLGSIALGAVHIIFGMCVKAYMCIRDGHPWEALFDIGSWWLLFAGIAVLALGGTSWILAAGVAALVLTQGRDKPTLIGKLVGGIASLYDITSYFSDLLSYTRLMALLLATSVIAQVVNILGALTGNIVICIVILIIGHGFNMGINIIGTYVHAARLQYLEFFGKFYKDGGRPFDPLKIKPRFVDIIKEEN